MLAYENHKNIPIMDVNNVMADAIARAPANFVSSVFHPDMVVDSLLPDFTILSSDSVLFFVHKHRLGHFIDLVTNSASHLYFNIPSMATLAADHDNRQPPCISVPENAQVVSIILHAVYDFLEIHFLCPPTFDNICSAIRALHIYGLTPLDRYVSPNTTTFQLLLSHASSSALKERSTDLSRPVDSTQRRNDNALRVYALAARNGLHDLAVAMSEHLLSFPLNSLSDEDAEQIGPVYLRRLFCLHLQRMSSLKTILLPPPCTPSQWFTKCASTKHTCDLDEFEKIMRAWSLTVSYITLNGTPDLDVHTLEIILRPVGEDIACPSCRRIWAERVYEVVTNYAKVKRTI